MMVDWIRTITLLMIFLVGTEAGRNGIDNALQAGARTISVDVSLGLDSESPIEIAVVGPDTNQARVAQQMVDSGECSIAVVDILEPEALHMLVLVRGLTALVCDHALPLSPAAALGCAHAPRLPPRAPHDDDSDRPGHLDRVLRVHVGPVGQRVAVVEDGELVTREDDASTPPQAGKRMVDAIADRLALADAQIAEEVAAERRELRVGAFPSALATIVPAAVSALLATVPDLQVSVTEGRTDALAGGVRDGSLHLAVAFQDAHAASHEHPGTRRHDLFTERGDAVG